MRCCDPTTRAASLLRTPGHVLATLSDGVSATCTATTPWGNSIVALVPPGELATTLRGTPRTDACLEVIQRTLTPTGTQEHGRLNLLGQLRAVPSGGRRQIALQLWDIYPTERLLDAVEDDGWLLAFLDPSEACWTLRQGAFPLDVAALLRAEPDRLLQASLHVCGHLNKSHPGIAQWLAGAPAIFSEIDRNGATLLIDDGNQLARVPWPVRCDSIDELREILENIPLRVRCTHSEASSSSAADS